MVTVEEGVAVPEFCVCGLEKGSVTGRPLVWLALHPSNQPLVVFGSKAAAEAYVALRNNSTEWTIEVAPVLGTVPEDEL